MQLVWGGVLAAEPYQLQHADWGQQQQVVQQRQQQHQQQEMLKVYPLRQLQEQQAACCPETSVAAAAAGVGLAVAVHYPRHKVLSPLLLLLDQHAQLGQWWQQHQPLG